MRLTFPDGSALDVEPIGTTSKGAPVVDDDTALQIAEAWQDVQGIDEYRGWTAPDDDSQPVPYIFGRVAPGSMTRVAFDEWPVIYDPAAGFDGESSSYSLHAFPYELDISE